jgi:hypothetical protein
MPRPRSALKALNKADMLKRGLSEYQAQQVEKLHKLILREFKSSDTKLFAVVGYKNDRFARTGLTLLLRRHAALQLESYWIADYLCCTKSDAETMESTAIRLIREQPGGVFATKLRTICEVIGVELKTVFPH